MALPLPYDRQTIQYHEDDCFSCNTGVTTVKMSNVSEERRQELSTMNNQWEGAKQIIENFLNDLDTPMNIRRLLWTNIGSLLKALADPSSEPSYLALEWHLIRLVLRFYADNGGNREDELRAAIESMERFFMTVASVVERAALQTWLESIKPHRSNALSVPGGGNNSISSLSGPSEGETPPNVAAADPVMSEAGNEAPPGVAAGAAAERGNHEDVAATAAVAVADGGNEGQQKSSSSVDYVYSASEATGSTPETLLVGVPFVHGSNAESGGTADSTRSGM